MTVPSDSYRLIPLTQGQFAKVSPHRFEELSKWKWCAHWSPGGKTFYAIRKCNGRVILMHRVILGLQRGDKKTGDHINHDTLDNTDENLRICTLRQNSANRQKPARNKSGYKGVWIDPCRGIPRYRAYITVGGKHRILGRYPLTPEGLIQAAKRYDEAARELYGEFAHLNFPTSPLGPEHSPEHS